MKIKIPKDYPVQPLKPGAVAGESVTCGTCGLSWDDSIATSMTPAPSGRCPFEPFHVERVAARRVSKKIAENLAHERGDKPYSFDGFGINGPDEYRDRVLTVTRIDAHSYPERAKQYEEIAERAAFLLNGDAITDLEKVRRGAAVAEVLGLRVSRDGRYKTEWGTKTPFGLFETVKRLILEGK